MLQEVALLIVADCCIDLVTFKYGMNTLGG